MPVARRLAAALALILTLAACAALVPPQKQLDDAFRDYSQRLRWRDYAGVAAYLPPEHRPAFLDHFADLDDLNIVDVTLETVDYREGEARATTSASVEYYLLPSLAVKKTRLRQEWLYEGGDRYHVGTWRLADPFPVFP
jgi:hypothetical protein